jgi:hypothetical protein
MSERPRRNAATPANRSSSTSSSSSSSHTPQAASASSSRPVRSTRAKASISLIESDEEKSDEEIVKSTSSKSTSRNTASAHQTKASTSSAPAFKVDMDKLAKLESITGLSRAEAMQLLEASGNKLEVAVDLHFNSGAKAVQEKPEKKATASSSNGTNGIKSLLNGNNKRALTNGDDDSNSNMSGEDYVRAPIPQKSEKMLDYDPYGK